MRQPLLPYKHFAFTLTLAVTGVFLKPVTVVFAQSSNRSQGQNPFFVAQSMDRKKQYLMAMRLRADTLAGGAYSAIELGRVGESALAFNRLGLVARLANQMKSKISMNQMPVAFRASVANALFQSGRVKEAALWMPSVQSLGQIAIGPARYRAHVVSSGIYAALGQNTQAIDALGPIIDGQDKQDIGFLRVQRARLFYDLKRYGEALEELVRVPKASPSWFAGMRVAVWASYQTRDYNLALGQLKSLHNPFLFGKFSPETYLVEANTLYRLCYFESALESIRRLRQKYTSLGTSLAQFRRSYSGSGQVADVLLSFVRGQERGAPDGYPKNHWKIILDGIMSAEPLTLMDVTYAQVEKEEKALNKDDSLRRFQGELSEAQSEVRSRMVPVIRQQLVLMERELRETLESSLAIEVEINTQIRERLMSGKVARRREVDFETEIKKGYEFWPFEGEYWRDEIGGYAYATTDVCGDLKL